MASKPLVVVCLATGAQGSAVALALVSSGRFRVRGLTRSPDSANSAKLKAAGVEMVKADATDKEEIEKAFQGAHGAFVVTDFWVLFEKEFEVATMTVTAAKKAGVKHLVWSSLADTLAQSGGKINVPHFVSKGKIEAVVKELGFEFYTFPMPGLYYENFSNPYMHFTAKGEEGEVLFTLPMAPEGTITAFDTADMGPAALAIFDDPEKWNGKHIALAGFHATAAEYVAVFEKVKKRKAVFKEVPAANEEIKVMFDWFAEYTYFGSYDRSTGRECYPKLKTWEEWLESTSWNGPE